MFPEERLARGHFSLCCDNGKVQLPAVTPPPELLRALFDGSDPRSRHFYQHIRMYNAVLGFTSFGAQLSDPVERGAGPGPPVVIVSGAVYHYSHRLFPEGDDDKPLLAPSSTLRR